jgi:transcription factor Dp-1
MSDFDEASNATSAEGGESSSSARGRKRPAPSPSPTASSTASNKSAKLRGGGKAGSRSSPTSEKSNRGLRHFSMMVCKKVEEKGTTTYNEVADELVRKVIAEREEERQGSSGKFDEKNIRRRVYDALNVLMAMDIISKDKKEITWKGLPTTNRQDLDSLKEEAQYRQDQVQQKREALRELLVQQVCFRNLVLHNTHQGMSEEKIPLPFIVVNTGASSVIQCDMSRDRTDVMFDFSMPFEINDDNTILKKMRM